MKKEVPYKESRIIGTTILLLITGFLFSWIPDISIKLLVFNLSIALFSGCLFYYFWKITKHNSKRYYSLLSFVMLNVMSIHFAIPLLRIYFLTLTFWIGVVMLIIMITLPYLYSREIAVGVQKPYKSKMGMIYLIYSALIITFGATAYSNSLYTFNPDAFTLALLGFLIAILFLFISPALLIKPKEMDEIMKE